jgi:predicted nucleic-acid-binding Zn-ribbon protein
MKSYEKCMHCGGDNLQKGRQEMFPSTFMPAGGGLLKLFRALSESREFDLFACQDCGHTVWFIKASYLEDSENDGE